MPESRDSIRWKPAIFASGLRLIRLVLVNALISTAVFALDPARDVSQYGHDAWTVRSGFIKGNVYTIAQTADGYLWLGSEFGLFRFDGVHTTPWQPPAGQRLPNPSIFRLLAARDGTLWIGTFGGLAAWKDGKLTRRPEMEGQIVGALLEDREGTVWAGSRPGGPPARLCAMRGGSTHCYGEDDAFGKTIWALSEDSSGNLWASTGSGLWRWMPGPPKRYATPPVELSAVSEADDGRPIIAMYGAGIKQVVGDEVESFPVRSAANSNKLLGDRDVNSNKLLRDRDGGLWIGTVERGLIHVHDGRTDAFTRSDGLSGDIVLSLFEDREGNVWVATTGGLDRFHELPVTTISAKQGLSSDAIASVLATPDGSAWIATHDGLTRWKNGQITVFRRASGLPDDAVQSLFQDDRERIWAFTAHGLAYFNDSRFVAVNGVPSEEVYSITGDKAGNVWLSGNRGLSHLLEGRLVEHFPWSALGRRQQAKAILCDQGGVWLSFWVDGGVLYFKDGKVRASYTAADGLGKGHVPDLRLDRDGALWAATEEGGLSRIKDGRVATLTTRNGLPCDTIHWSIEDDDRFLWLWTACGLVRIARGELDAWIADPTRRIETTVWDAMDGVWLRSVAATAFRPPVARSTDGKLWFVTGEGVQVIDPHHLVVNKLPPPVRIESVKADGKTYDLKPGMRLPANVHDVWIDYTALSLVAPQKVHFKYRLEGQDSDWKEVVNDREAQYSNLAPRSYRFRVIASNNSGVWNETGDALEFSIDPAYYQTNWFRAFGLAVLLALVGIVYRIRVRGVEEREKKFREAVESMPALAFVASPENERTFVNKRWVEYTGLTLEQASGSGWHAAVHPDDLKRVLNQWQTAMTTGKPLDYELRLRHRKGDYRWFHTRVAPLEDNRGRIVKWCGVATDIEDRKCAEEERERLRELQGDLAHINRVNMMGELAASIAHEVNQPLAGIVNNGSACLRWLAGNAPNLEEAGEAVGDMVRDAKRAGEVIGRIRALTKRTAPPRERLDLNETIREVLALVGAEAKRNSVSIRTRFADDLSPVLGDRVQLQQVLLNLVMNAMEAMSSVDGRTRELTITTCDMDADHVQVTVEDSGVGIAPDVIERVFDAFYTTKSSGMGMGLSISRSIIQNHGGRLWAAAKDGGTIFHFTLPKCEEEQSHAGVAGA